MGRYTCHCTDAQVLLQVDTSSTAPSLDGIACKPICDAFSWEGPSDTAWQGLAVHCKPNVKAESSGIFRVVVTTTTSCEHKDRASTPSISAG